MSRNDNYERLCRFYELLGKIRDRDAFKEALQQTVSSEDLDVSLPVACSREYLFFQTAKEVEDASGCAS